MADRLFPGIPPARTPEPVPIELVVRREPLLAIREVLAISIHDVVNDARHKRIVFDFYRIARRIQNESWLRRRLRQMEDEAWVRAHL